MNRSFFGWRLIGLLLIGFTLAGSSITPAHAQSGDAVWLLGQINALRARYGAGPLSINGDLTNSATEHSQYLANNTWTDPHVEANGSTPRSRTLAAGFTGPIGENVYGGGIATAAIAFNWWVNEPLHFRALVNTDFKVVGIGIASGPYGHYFTLDFGGDGSPNVAVNPPAPGSNIGNTNSSSNSVAAAPIPTRRPLPTATPTITLTPSITFTPSPSDTAAPTTSPIPPTATAIVLEVSPQANSVSVSASVTDTLSAPAGQQVAVLPSPDPAPADPALTSAPAQVSLLASAAPIGTLTNTPGVASSRTSNNTLFGLVIVAGVAVQGVLVAGFVVRQFKNR